MGVVGDFTIIATSSRSNNQRGLHIIPNNIFSNIFWKATFLVTMKFNMINWALETISTLLVIIIINDLIVIVYILIMSCGTPLVYFLGIEDNRKTAKEVLKVKMKVLTKKKNIEKRLSSFEIRMEAGKMNNDDLKIEDI